MVMSMFRTGDLLRERNTNMTLFRLKLERIASVTQNFTGCISAMGEIEVPPLPSTKILMPHMSSKFRLMANKELLTSSMSKKEPVKFLET
jgi:hypothetical protein